MNHNGSAKVRLHASNDIYRPVVPVHVPPRCRSVYATCNWSGHKIDHGLLIRYTKRSTTNAGNGIDAELTSVSLRIERRQSPLQLSAPSRKETFRVFWTVDERLRQDPEALRVK